MDRLSSTLRFGHAGLRLATGAMLLCCTGCLLAPSQRSADDAIDRHDFPEKHSQNAQTPTAAKSPSPTANDMSATMAEVYQLGQTDPAAQQALVDDLRRTDPSLWPQLVSAYRSSLAYKQQSTERLARLAQNNGPLGSVNANNGSAMPAANSSNPALATTSPSNQSLPGNAYPATATPYLQDTADLGPFSMQPSVQPIPAASDAALLSNPAAAPPAANYPNTNYPEVRLAAAESYSIQNSDSPRYKLTADEGSPDDWQSQFAAAIRAMESKVATGANSSPSATDQAMLRLMYLAAGRREDALSPLDGVSLAEREFWNKELAGLANLLDQEGDKADPKRTTEAAQLLQQAVARLKQSSPLTVHRLAFCTEVNSFGVYKPAPTDSFKPGQQLLLYAEIENFISEETAKGHRTSLRSRYEIVDASGKRVSGEDFGETEELCRNSRRDFFVRYFLKLPKSLSAGQYTLQLMIEDTIGAKNGRGQISFTVAE